MLLQAVTDMNRLILILIINIMNCKNDVNSEQLNIGIKIFRVTSLEINNNVFWFKLFVCKTKLVSVFDYILYI